MSATAESKTKFEVASLDSLEPYPDQEGRLRMAVRRTLGINGFGVSAYGTSAADVDVVREHDEASPWSNGHEELYVVVAGHATFTIDGEEIDAPAGTLVFVADRNAKRGAVARAEGTRVIAIGERPASRTGSRPARRRTTGTRATRRRTTRAALPFSSRRSPTTRGTRFSSTTSRAARACSGARTRPSST